ncbi:outer membrane protein assembly factor BamB family protein [Actinoplanes aureus]|uniref:PQQ-binding-like beta-propeller repeat protein n=1 Tax=Actinoplanes aureus TaxID=2792083 RepID=A0A931C7Z5_9ACTN|nr:PQQ-binding-like beta-propeller repeat protein [Actinoplanes aureus]MBG0560005.1 PQQ-binding-like beta-propeller repeat protein [Actinoplanes aureus]
MSGVLIDLGEVARFGSGPAADAPAPPVPYRLLLAILSVALVVSLGGAGVRSEPAPPTVISARLGDAIRVVGDRLFVIGRGAAEGKRTIRTYALPDATLLSEHTVMVTGDVLSVDAAGDLLLVTVQDERTVTFGTIALRPGLDQPLWQRPVQLQGLSVADGLALVREEGAPFGDADWHGVDLRTGTVRWTVHQGDRDDIGVSSYTGGYPKWLYTLTGNGQLVARDTRTGRTVASVHVPQRQGASTSLWPAGDLVMIGAGGSGTTGYDVTAGLEPRWHTGMNLSWYRGPAQCGELICAFLPQRGILVIDPTTGRERWSSDRWDYAERVGDRLLTGMPGTAYPRLYVLDPATGDVLGDVGLWQSSGPGPEPGTAYVRRTVSGEDRLWYGVLLLDRLRIRVLGAAERVAGDCHFTAGVLVCRRIDASVGVWRLR